MQDLTSFTMILIKTTDNSVPNNSRPVVNDDQIQLLDNLTGFIVRMDDQIFNSNIFNPVKFYWRELLSESLLGYVHWFHSLIFV